MARMEKLKSRDEITESAREYEERMDAHQEELEKTVHDNELLVDTFEQLELGTSDADTSIREHGNQGDEKLKDAFSSEDERLEETQTEQHELGEDVDERTRASERSEESISQTERGMVTDHATREVAEAAQEASKDTDFLQEQLDELKAAAERSESEQRNLRQQLNELRMKNNG